MRLTLQWAALLKDVCHFAEATFASAQNESTHGRMTARHKAGLRSSRSPPFAAKHFFFFIGNVLWLMKLPFLQMGAWRLEWGVRRLLVVAVETFDVKQKSFIWWEGCGVRCPFFLADGCNGLNIVPNIYKQNKLLWPDGPCRCGEPGRMQTQDLIQAQETLIVSSADWRKSGKLNKRCVADEWI